MKENKRVPDARKRILKTALQIFAEKSFEGSRIDEIAERAGVPKSLIYYHFKNKNEILDVMFRNFLNDFGEVIKTAERDAGDSVAEEMMKRPEYYTDFMIKNYDLIRIILIDSLKKTSDNPVLYTFLEMIVHSEEKLIIRNHPENYDREERLVGEFFTHIIPLFSFFCFYYSWIGYFKMEEKKFGDLFKKILAETHGAFHKNRK